MELPTKAIETALPLACDLDRHCQTIAAIAIQQDNNKVHATNNHFVKRRLYQKRTEQRSGLANGAQQAKARRSNTAFFSHFSKAPLRSGLVPIRLMSCETESPLLAAHKPLEGILTPSDGGRSGTAICSLQLQYVLFFGLFRPRVGARELVK